MREQARERWRVGDLTIEVGEQIVMQAGRSIALPQLSFKFLMALVRAAPNVLSIDELMEQVWTGVFVNSETITQRAKLLRDALGDDPRSPRYFTVRRGAGYQLVPAPRRLDGKESEVRSSARPWQRRRVWALGAVALGLASVGLVANISVWRDAKQNAVTEPIRIAVLPFENLSSDPGDAFIARSIPEMVLNRLSSVRGLSVISRESALLSSAGSAAPKEAGAQLKAAYIVKGSVQRSGETLRVTCFVVDVVRGTRLWSEQFDWPINRIYALQDRIADHVASSLESKVRGLGGLSPAAVPTRNTDAYLAYLRGTALLGRFTVAETDAAAHQFERAVQLDPQFAQALVALFDARMQGADLRKDDLGPYRTRYQPLLDKALALEPSSGSALFAKAMWSDIGAAERRALYSHAAELDPSNSRGLTSYAEFLDKAPLGLKGPNDESGKKLLARVLAMDPLSPRARFWLVMRDVQKLTPEQADRKVAQALELDPTNYPLANRYAKRRWLFHGETADALQSMERVIATDPQNPWGPHIAVALYLDADDLAAAQAIAATTPASRDSSRALLAQYAGNIRGAGEAAMDRRGFLFNQYENWNWAETVRDYALKSGQFDRGAEGIASRYGFDLRNPQTTSISQSLAAVPLSHILMAAGKREIATKLLVQTVQWVDNHPTPGPVGLERTRAGALMLLGQQQSALSNLRASIETGHDIHHWWYVIYRDPVWASVRGDPRFRQIADLCRQAAAVQRAKLDAMRKAGTIPTRSATARS